MGRAGVAEPLALAPHATNLFLLHPHHIHLQVNSATRKPAPKSAAEFGRFRRFVVLICWGFWDSRTPDWEVSL